MIGVGYILMYKCAGCIALDGPCVDSIDHHDDAIHLVILKNMTVWM
jgi:hypothetical protein